MNEADTRDHLIAPVLRDKGCVSRDRITLETILTPAPAEPSGPKSRRRDGPGRTDHLLCVQVGDAPKPLPVVVLEAKKETDDPLSLAALALPIERVFMTENETNFLAFPAAARAIVVFGAGYGWEALVQAGWLQRCHLHYWGDIDTHGFAILAQLRGHFPHASSFLMDREALLAHRAFWGEEPEPVRHDLRGLTMQEASLYDDLRFDRIRPGLRLEQERIGYGWLTDHLRHFDIPPAA